MPSVLLAGCGYVGTAAAKLFARSGWQVIGWRLNSSPELGGTNITIKRVDIVNPEQIAQACFDADVVVHCAGVGQRDPESYRRIYHHGMSNLVKFFPAARIIFTSSTRVYPQTDGSWVNERSPTEPQSEHAAILLQAEQIAHAHGGTVLRLGGIYGPGRSFLLRRALEGIPPPPGDRFVNQIHRDDAASAVFFVRGDQSDVAGQIFNVVDDAPVWRSEILRWLKEQLSLPASPLFSAEQSAISGKSNKRVSNSKLRKLGWTPTYKDYREAFAKSIFPSFNIVPAKAPSQKI